MRLVKSSIFNNVTPDAGRAERECLRRRHKAPQDRRDNVSEREGSALTLAFSKVSIFGEIERQHSKDATSDSFEKHIKHIYLHYTNTFLSIISFID